jgi:hypothetical protein
MMDSLFFLRVIVSQLKKDHLTIADSNSHSSFAGSRNLGTSMLMVSIRLKICCSSALLVFPGWIFLAADLDEMVHFKEQFYAYQLREAFEEDCAS